MHRRRRRHVPLKIAYLASQDTLPGSQRRSDAFEFDRMQDALCEPFARRGMSLEPIAWDAMGECSRFDAAMIGTPWDYWERRAEFLDALAHIEAHLPLFNPTSVVRKNSDKRYLRDLPTPPTLFVDVLDDHSMAGAFATFGCAQMVAKQQVGAGAFGQLLLDRSSPLPATTGAMLLQPFLPSILEHGEISIILIDGQISHAVRKLPTAGDYRIQSMYGGRNLPHTPTAAETDLAMEVAPVGLLYARVDVVYFEEKPLLMELELIEPYLYPEQGPQLGDRLAEALLRRLGS